MYPLLLLVGILLLFYCFEYSKEFYITDIRLIVVTEPLILFVMDAYLYLSFHASNICCKLKKKLI